MRHTSTRHALDINRLSPGIASRRMTQLATSSPFAAAMTLSKLAMEKSFAFSSSWFAATVAITRWQLRWAGNLSAATSGAGLTRVGSRMAADFPRDSETIARSTLAPVARRVRKNSRGR